MGKSSVLLIDLHRLISARQWWISPNETLATRMALWLGYGGYRIHLSLLDALDQEDGGLWWDESSRR